MNWPHMDGALIWSMAIVAGPIVLGLALAYGAMLRRRRNAPESRAPEYRRDDTRR